MRMLSEIMKSSLKKIKLPVFIILYSAALLLTLPQNAYAMHIMEGRFLVCADYSFSDPGTAFNSENRYRCSQC